MGISNSRELSQMLLSTTRSIIYIYTFIRHPKRFYVWLSMSMSFFHFNFVVVSKTLIFIFFSFLLFIFINMKLIEHTTQIQTECREILWERTYKKAHKIFRAMKLCEEKKIWERDTRKKVRMRERELNDRPTQAKISFMYMFFGKKALFYT